MSDNDKGIICVTSIVCAAVVSLVLGIFCCINYRTKLFVENGYTRQTLVGQSVPQWVKETKE